MPRCKPPAELKREMILIDGKLPAPKQLPPLPKPSTQSTKTIQTSTNAPEEPSRVSRNNVIDEENLKHASDSKPLCVKKEKSGKSQCLKNDNQPWTYLASPES